MKKTLILLGLVGAIGVSYGQGYVTVAGTYSNQTNNTPLTSSWTGGLLAGGGAIGNVASGQSYTVALLTSAYSGTTNPLALFGTSALSSWVNSGPQGANTTFAGRLSIGTDYATTSGAPVGQNNQWILVAWTTSLGSWATVSADLISGLFASSGYVGWSAVGIGAAGDSPANLGSPLIIQGASGSIIPSGMSLLAVSPVPEPSTMALAGLGGAALLLFRRRK